ncbi:DUF262 domain-containing protein [Curtobacterium citreum]|uniref:DUF262 domain-containing protein n=1 Tax=Curtobacterium citreum TaxID=2036 RepID=A0ABT2HLS9_9MICO|nr:DUF262 domain-containing protein [Curtobacterium citreum]MCS6524229.1 DUF262 domain-containing protein [Curtobacterium citreum]TQJ27575.1 uncharacterized protein DUF262 [Curtobacterium citreum]
MAEADDDIDSTVLERTLTNEELDDLVAPEATATSVTFSTQDFDVAGLVTRLKRGSMLVPSFGHEDERITSAGFQRGFVWSKAQMDRFVESLLLGYPIPGIFLVRQSTDNRLLVLDGQQRLVTLRRFYEGMHQGREFKLENVGVEFRGLTYESLDDALRFKLDDSYLQATIVHADGSDEVNDAVYQIFERLNAGGTQLTPHEIRVALYAGPFIDLLERLNTLSSWRVLYGKKSARIRDQELVLRILALFAESASYARPLKAFLNRFVAAHRMQDGVVDQAGALFERAAERLAEIGPRVMRRPGGGQVNMAQAEAVFVAVMEGLQQGALASDLGAAIDQLVADDGFTSATTRATADKDAVTARLDLARRRLVRR